MDLQLCAVVTGPRGNKSSPLLTSDGKPVSCKLPPTTTPFNAGVYGDQPSTRLNLDLRCDDPAYQKFLKDLDFFESWQKAATGGRSEGKLDADGNPVARPKRKAKAKADPKKKAGD